MPTNAFWAMAFLSLKIIYQTPAETFIENSTLPKDGKPGGEAPSKLNKIEMKTPDRSQFPWLFMASLWQNVKMSIVHLIFDIV